MAVVKKGELPSVIHNNECSEAIVKWGNENGYPLIKAKMFDEPTSVFPKTISSERTADRLSREAGI